MGAAGQIGEERKPMEPDDAEAIAELAKLGDGEAMSPGPAKSGLT